MGTEFKELMDELCEASKLVAKEVKKIVTKGDLTPSELESLYKASCFAEKVKHMSENQMEDMSYGQYSMNYRGNYGDPMGYSEARGRSPVTGRYISRGMDGYSGHSIEDRMIASLEQQMDNANSEYERQLIQKEIKHIRMGNAM